MNYSVYCTYYILTVTNRYTIISWRKSIKLVCFKSFGKFIIINAFLVVINLLSSGQLSWSLYILLLWGMGLGVKVWNNYQLQGEEYEQAFSKWYRKQQITDVANSIYLRVNNWIKGL